MTSDFNMSKFQIFSEYVIWFLLGNVYFLICNLPIILFLVFIGTKNINTSLILFGVCLIPLGPSLTALFYSMSKIVKYKEVAITKAFFSSYIKNFFQSVALSGTQALLIIALTVNLQIFKKLSFGYILTPLFYILFALTLLLTFYAYPLLSRFHMKTLDIFRLSFILIFTSPFITLGNIIIILFSFVLIDIKASYASLFIISVTCFLIIFLEEHLLKRLESQSKSCNNTLLS